MTRNPVLPGALLCVLLLSAHGAPLPKESPGSGLASPEAQSSDGSVPGESSAPSAERGAGLIAYTLRVWKTDEFDFTEVGRIYHEYMPAMLAGELSAAEVEEKVDRGLAQVTGSGKIPVADGRPGESLGQKVHRLRMAVFASGIVKQQIVTCKFDGTDRKQLTFEGDNGRPDWSPDGKKIAYSAQRGTERWVGVMDGDGANQKLLTLGEAPDWSPDGTRIAYAIGGQIWVMNADESENAQVTHSETRKNGPSWSPDGKQMVFIIGPTRDTPRPRRPKLGIMNADGTNERLLTNEDRTNTRVEPDGSVTVIESTKAVNAPAWSPVDDRIAFWSGVEGRAPHGQVWVMKADGTGSTQLTASPDRNNTDDPTWSPDGTKILFTRAEGGFPKLG